VTLKLYRPGPGGLEPAPAVKQDYRTRLRSRRWQLPALANPEAQPASPLGAVILFGILAVITLAVLIAGYSSGFWGA